MGETDFIAAIDGCFPYTDRPRALALVEAACALSANAAFTVAHELARPPRSAGAATAERLDLLAALAARFDHPLAPLILGVARRMICGEQLTVAEARAALEAVEAHSGPLQALSIVYFSCPEDASIEAEYGRIAAALNAP